VRTTQTATFFCEALGLEASIIRSEFSLYNSGVGNYLNVINQIPESVNKALLVGHNPTISDLVNYLSDTYEVDLPTAGFVKLALLSDTWEGVGSGIASIEWVKVPENQI
jgi:phosphohistidine phosphatase